MDQEILQHEALLAYKSMVNNHENSDITITTTGGQTLHTHKVILATRCPKLLQVGLDVSISLLFNVKYIYFSFQNTMRCLSWKEKNTNKSAS